MENDIILLLTFVSRTTKETIERKFQGHGIHAGQQLILQLLWKTEGPLKIGELAQRLRVEYPTITRTVQRMEREGLLKRQRDPADERQVLVELTPQGRALEAVVPQILAEMETQLLADLSDVERALLIRIMNQMLQNLEAPST